MDQYFRRYVLVHGFFIGIAALFMAPLSVIFKYNLPDYAAMLWLLSVYTNCEWIGSWAWLVGALWLLVGGCFLYGMVKRRKRALQPLLLMLGIQLLLIFIEEMLLTFGPQHFSSGYIMFLDASEVANIIYVLFHVSFTMVSLGKLFDESLPQSSWKEMNNAVYGRTTLSVPTESS